jgi:hypothetical protein
MGLTLAKETPMRRRWVVAAVGICVLAGVVFARPGVLITSDGRRIEGDITERNDQYVVNIRGVETTIPKTDVSSVTFPEDYAKDFHDRMSKLKPDDVSGRIELARDAFNRRQYGLAREALDSAMKIDPNNREAYDLQNTIDSQIRLEQGRGAPADTRPVPMPPPTAYGVERRLLTGDQINLMRQLELQPGDRVNVRFDNAVEKRYMKYRNIQFNDFNAFKPVDRALKILGDGDESMRPDVKILGDPQSIADYRRTVQPLVLNGCATANCHGGLKGGDFILYNPADNDAVSYTNLFILFRYRKKLPESHATVFDSPARKMIDRGAGVRSLLAQYGLPVDISEVDHPQVTGYDFVFRNMEDVRFKQVVDWMDKSLRAPEPDYSGIKFDPPRAPATQPAK